MKCISLWQPYATLIAILAKQFETRSWSTTYRGPIAIHASKRKMDGIGVQLLCDLQVYNSMPPVPYGVIVAVANLADVWPTTDPRIAQLSEQERMCGDYSPGRFAWKLENVRALRAPVPLVGHQGLFNLAPETIEAIRRAA